MAIVALEFRPTRRPSRSRAASLDQHSLDQHSVGQHGVGQHSVGQCSTAQRRLGLGLLGCGFAMVPWLFVLAATLPGSTGVPHWSLAWVGLDAMEATGLVLTGWLLRRDDPRRALTAMATSALLVTDAWFDISTAGPGGALYEAIAMAVCAEIPMAVLCAALAHRAIRRD